MAKQDHKLTVVLFGNASAVHFGAENLLLGQDQPIGGNVDISQIVPVSRVISGHRVFVINLLGLQESDLPQHTVDQLTGGLVKEHEIHAFILVLCQLTDSDKLGLEWLQRMFGESTLSFVMMLFTYERDDCDTVIDDLKKNPALEQLLTKCGGRYHTCSKRMNNQSEIRTLLEKIDLMISENKQPCYTADMFNTTLKLRTDTQKSQKRACKLHQQQEKLDIKETNPEPDAAGCQPDKIKDISELFTKLLGHQKQKLKLTDILQLKPQSIQTQKSCSDLVARFLQKLLMVNYRARNIYGEEETSEQDDFQPDSDDSNVEDANEFFSSTSETSDEANKQHAIHSMDVQMAVFHWSDNFLKQFLVNKLSQCQYALPLLVPNPETKEIEFPLWSFRQISRSWKTTGTSDKVANKTLPICEAETPMMAFFRFGSVSSSKSQLINSLINDRHPTFFHRHCPGSSSNCLLMDGVAEIAWYYPSGKETDHFPDCVAFCNLHGDAETNTKQLEILTEMSSVNVVLLSDHIDVEKNQTLTKIYNIRKPLICIHPNQKYTGYRKGSLKVKIGHVNQYEDLKKALKWCLSRSSTSFRLKNLSNHKNIKTDENDGECQKGKAAALQMMALLEGKELSKVKETKLPCQGKPWHDWSQKSKELHQLQGTNIEKQKCAKQSEMKLIREGQYECGVTDLMKLFIHMLSSSETNERDYFLKWLNILLDKFTTDVCQANDESPPKGRVLSLEHILREMGQIYESFTSVQMSRERDDGEDFLSLPKLAAEVVLSGYPLELMDSDAAHVPLIWVSAVLDELIKKLGDQRVFVLSVLGIQSTGKSTMLNAMFGLQFAVSAGRCTRGAFMQLVRVSEEMKEELKFDYVLIVDTEGLRSLEQTETTPVYHDNKLATFVIGLGHLTLINVFGENPAEMQEILQIVVQALLRMKKVRLNPSCMFVHQNVSDITATEKTKLGRKSLEKKLDEMTRLAAKEEDTKANFFHEIIKFDIDNDVMYFAQLWEGSPPMAPPNPSYSENVQELKNKIISKIPEKQVIKLSQFKSHLDSLWTALLNENFVFSFKNTLEIAAYRKLENEYCKWTWKLRSTMLTFENKLHNRVNNTASPKIDESDIIADMKVTRTDVNKSISAFFDEDQDKEILIQWRETFKIKISHLHDELVKRTKEKLDEVIRLKRAREQVDREKTNRETELYKLSKELAFGLKNKEIDEEILVAKFEEIWYKCVIEQTPDTSSIADIDIWGDVAKILSESYETSLVIDRQTEAAYEKINMLGNYLGYIILKEKDVPQAKDGEDSSSGESTSSFTKEDNNSLRVFIGNIIKATKEEIQKKPIAARGYSHIYIPEIIASIKRQVEAYQSQNSKIQLKKEFTVDLCLHVCKYAVDEFSKSHKEFREANDVRMYLERQKPQYFKVFENCCKGSASTAVFGEFIVDKLEPSVLQAAYDQTGLDVAEKMKRDFPAFSGNRSNLEKHILTSLAEQESFELYIEYLHKPKEHFHNFIWNQVDNYITKENRKEVLKIIKRNISSKIKCVKEAVNKVTDEVKGTNDVNMWLQLLSKELKDVLQFKEESWLEEKEITDLEFLQKIINKGLTDKFHDQFEIKMEMFRKKPHEIMTEHLCRCCWVQCPFCNAICTNTLEDHNGDHNVRFHRNCAINGWSFKFSDNLGIDFCTTVVSSKQLFCTADKVLTFKDYRDAGGDYAKWNISPDSSEMPYWKWFVCRFQKELENHYNKKFTGNGEIPQEWRKIAKDEAVKSLREL